jgi:hypothetical protein
MEMGVDIGGINTVAMNNVPPHPANYCKGLAEQAEEVKHDQLPSQFAKIIHMIKTYFEIRLGHLPHV